MKTNPVLIPDMNQPILPVPGPSDTWASQRGLWEEVEGIKAPTLHSLKQRGGLSPPQFNLTPSEGEAALREMKRSLPTPFTARKHQPKSWP